MDCTTSLLASAMTTAAAHVMPVPSRKMVQSVVSLTKSDVRHPLLPSGSLQWNADRKYV